MALLVDSSEFSSATWSTYQPTFAVNLPAQDGDHSVWVGLKGRPSDSEPTWVMNLITKDVSRPLIVITNPVALTTSQPLIQLRGYSPEALASVRYDVANASGTIENQEGFVLKQWYDTNLSTFTTNWFECPDITLTPGANTVTLRVTDLAGNTSTETRIYTLDYSTDHTPPALTLYWPQDGATIAGSSFTLRGWIGDPTATVSVQITDAAQNTTQTESIVEPDGAVWVEDLPLAAGGNTLVLTMTDAAGNSSSRTLVVNSSTTSLTIDSLGAVDLNSSPIDVSGTIGSGGFKVWVNGKEATILGTVWSAHNIPLNEGGTALVQVRAIPTSDNGGNGTGGSGGATTSYQNPGNPASPSARDIEFTGNKPPVIMLTRHQRKNTNYTQQLYDEPYLQHTDTEELCWQPGDSGYWTFDTCEGPATGTWYHIWGDRAWDVSGVGTTVGGAGGNCSEKTAGAPPSEFTVPTNWSGQWCEVGARRYEIIGDKRYLHARTRMVQTECELRTGGKRNSSRKNLFVLNSEATGRGNPFWPEFDVDSMSYTISPTAIHLGKLGNLGNDGKLYKVLADNTSHDVTPRITGSKYFTYELPVASKHELHIAANGLPLADDRVAPGAGFCAGQKINFSLYWVAQEPPSIQGKTTAWVLTGSFVNAYTQWHDIEEINYGSKDYYINDSILRNQSTYAWWLEGQNPDGRGESSIATLLLQFSNGQGAFLTMRGRFTIYEPAIQFDPDTQHPAAVRLRHGSILNYPAMGLGDDSQSGAMGFGVAITSKEQFPGQGGCTQLINRWYQRELLGLGIETGGTGGEFLLDTSEFYDSFSVRQSYPGLPVQGVYVFSDTPGATLQASSWFSLNDQFKTYFRFRPDGDDNIYITLARVDWNWFGDADLTEGLNSYLLENWTLGTGGVTGPTFKELHELPHWHMTYAP